MTRLLTFPDAFAADTSKLEAARVDCGNCPLSLECVAGIGGSGHKFPCCGATSVMTTVEGAPLLVVVDCARNGFHTVIPDPVFRTCPLCSGDIVLTSLVKGAAHLRYLPTVHARVDARARLKCWRDARSEALTMKKQIDARRQALPADPKSPATR